MIAISSVSNTQGPVHAPKPPIIIPIGHACTMASALRDCGIRRVAYPFDWIATRFDGIVKAFSDHFQHFFEPASLRNRWDNHGVVDYYGFEFVHDLPTLETASLQDDPIGESTIVNDWQPFVPAIYQKYQRRMLRFNNAVYGNETVYFMRHQPDITKRMAQKLYNTIREAYPSLHFILVVAGRSDDMKRDWQLPNVRNFYYDERFPTLHHVGGWKIIFNALGFTPELGSA